MELKLYFSDLGWQGSVTIIAASFEDAFKHAKPEYHESFTIEEFKNTFTEHEIKDGLVLVCLGDL